MTNVSISKLKEEIKRVYEEKEDRIVELLNLGKGHAEEWTEETEKIFVEIARGFDYSECDKEYKKYTIEDKETKLRKLKIWKASKPKEFMGIDQVWFNERPIVGIEYENHEDFEKVSNDEFQKLLFFKSEFKILVWYADDWKDWDDYEQKYIKKFKKLVKRYANNDEYYMIISIAGPDSKNDTKVGEVEWGINVLVKKEEGGKIIVEDELSEKW